MSRFFLGLLAALFRDPSSPPAPRPGPGKSQLHLPEDCDAGAARPAMD